MKLRSRLKHVAVGLIDTFISRYNDVGGHWALGLLYQDVSAPPQTLELDLLNLTAHPAGDCAAVVVERYAIYLRAALKKQKNLAWDDLTLATITIQFNAPSPDPDFHYQNTGDPLVATVRLQSRLGLDVSRRAVTRCYPFQPYQFTRSMRFQKPT